MASSAEFAQVAELAADIGIYESSVWIDLSLRQIAINEVSVSADRRI
jgi:hypothetical protein